MALQSLGWSAFEVTLEDGRRRRLDPFLAGLPDQGIAPSPAKVEEFDGVHFVLVTHVTGDHLGQAFDVLGRGQARVDAYIAEIKASKKARGADAIYLPGEPEHRRAQERRETGIPLHPKVAEELRAIGKDLAVASDF